MLTVAWNDVRKVEIQSHPFCRVHIGPLVFLKAWKDEVGIKCFPYLISFFGENSSNY